MFNFNSIFLLKHWIPLTILTISLCNFSTAAAAGTTFTVINASDSGAGSLRQAILDANSTADADKIVFDSALAGYTIPLTGGEMEITQPLTITGVDALTVTIKADNTDRIFKVSSGIAVRIEFLTLEGSGSTTILGGSIYNNGGDLELVHCTIQNGNANQGAIFNTNNGTLKLEYCTFKDNIAQFGAALFNENGIATVENCLMIHNGSSEDGSHGSIENGSSDTLNVINSTFTDNSADVGAGITNYGTAIIKNSTFNGNQTTSATGNRKGGALYNAATGSATVINSTFSNNTAYWIGGAIANAGSLDMTNSTIVENFADNTSSGLGGGIYNGSGANLIIKNSIVSANVINNAGASSPEIENVGLFVSSGKNIFGFNGGIGIYGATPTAVTYLTPAAGLGIGNIVNDLADNGGPTQTRSPIRGGLAQNAGDNLKVISEYDQRGGWRILDGIVDIGAVEIGVVPLNDTGITSCSDDTQNGLDCAVAGFPSQDAEFGSNGFDFTAIDSSGDATTPTSGANPHPCVRDNVTGLIWEVKTDDGGLRDKDNTYTWYDSIAGGTANGGSCAGSTNCDTEKYVADVNAAGLCGFNDWRMPTVKELYSIVHFGGNDPAINTTYFPNTTSDFFWSGSPYVKNSDDAWFVRLVGGYAATYGRNSNYHVRLVRGGQSFDAFVDNGDGTVTQINTGLMWAKCSEGRTGSNCGTGSATTMNWSDALTAANNSILGGYTDWRLPNIKELQALINYDSYKPAIYNSYFSDAPSPRFWSGSASLDYGTNFTWYTGFESGFTYYTYRTDNYSVRLVRGGLSFNTFQLTVNKTGNGIVTSNGNLINCGVICSYPFFDTTRVTLTAAADAGFTFVGWNGGGRSGIGDCVVTMDAAKTVTATFAVPQTLTIDNSGNGTVTGTGINCTSGTCVSSHTGVVSLTATPNSGYQFAGWDGACLDANVICNVPMTAAQDVTATFAPITADTGSSWEQITITPPVTDWLYGVTWNGNTFVAVGASGKILTSPDGLTWTPQTSNTSAWCTGVTWNGSRFVVVCGAGKIVTSDDDGVTWVVRTSGTANTIYKSTWSGSQFVAVGEVGTILTSSDGLTWATQNSGTVNNLYGVTWNGSQFVAVGHAGTILTSTDGETWTSITPVTANNLERVAWNGNKFVAVGSSGTILTSTNGSAWSTQTSGTNSFYGLTWTGNQFVAVGLNGIILTSPDGETWTTQTSGTTKGLSGVTWNGSKLVVTGETATVLTSPATSQTLTVTVSGAGAVTSAPAGIDCGTDCSETYATGTSIILTATATGSTINWSGCTPIGTNQCQVTVDANKTITANFTPLTYSITATANPITGGSVSCSPNPIAHGGSSNCTATPNTGYSFTGFGGDCSGTSCALTNITANKTVTANFTPLTYSITATANPTAGGTVNCTPNPIAHGGSSNCTATPNTGYSFTGFGGDCSGTICALTNVTANKTITANFTPLTYSITATANPIAGGAVNCSPNPIAHGGSANCTATPNTGYSFTGFGGDCSGIVCAFTGVIANKTVTANFTPLTYSITATANPTAGGVVNCSAISVEYGGSANCTATPNTGYSFTGFGGDCSGTICALTNVTANKTVTANFTSLTYSITATANPTAGGVVNCSASSVEYGGSANCTASPNTGYSFTGFGGDCSGTSCALTNITANKTITANFTAIGYSITATATPIAGGVVNCSTNSVEYGGSANCTASPNTGYSFTGFDGDCSGTICALTNVTANKTITANFTPLTYSITATANPTAGGVVNCSASSVEYGGASNCTATPNTGYSFTGFGGDCSGTSCALTNITANKTITANFTAMGYSITATANPIAGGVVNCSTNSVEYGGSANCTATPNTGYSFTGFGGDCSGTICALTNVTANKTITANFTAISTTKKYKLLIDKTGSGEITSDFAGINCGSICIASFNAETKILLTATPASGETFIRWTGCDSINTAKQCTVTLNRIRLIGAAFTANVAPIADFIITDIHLSPSQPNAGIAFDAAITVKNQGTTAMNGGILSVWANLPTGKNCGAISTVTTAIGVLSAKESKTFSVSLPPMTYGNKRLRVFADGNCETSEANESNNQSFLDYSIK
ncbi:hypothetical protein CKO09_07870 [Chromatium weissei]|nr:hypothetical protein [Chromatium weissei]